MCTSNDTVDVGRGEGSCNSNLDCPCCAPFCSSAGYCQTSNFQTTIGIIDILFEIDFFIIADLVFDLYLSIMTFTYLELGTQREGEVCGSCFNPETNYDCGKCVDGLECVKDPQSDLLPDLPSRCRANFGKF